MWCSKSRIFGLQCSLGKNAAPTTVHHFRLRLACWLHVVSWCKRFNLATGQPTRSGRRVLSKHFNHGWILDCTSCMTSLNFVVNTCLTCFIFQSLGLDKRKLILIGPPPCNVNMWGASCKEKGKRVKKLRNDLCREEIHVNTLYMLF